MAAFAVRQAPPTALQGRTDRWPRTLTPPFILNSPLVQPEIPAGKPASAGATMLASHRISASPLALCFLELPTLSFKRAEDQSYHKQGPTCYRASTSSHSSTLSHVHHTLTSISKIKCWPGYTQLMCIHDRLKNELVLLLASTCSQRGQASIACTEAPKH